MAASTQLRANMAEDGRSLHSSLISERRRADAFAAAIEAIRTCTCPQCGIPWTPEQRDHLLAGEIQCICAYRIPPTEH